MDKVTSRHVRAAFSENIRRLLRRREHEPAASHRKLLMLVIPGLIVAICLAFQGFALQTAHAQTGPGPTLIRIGVPAQTNLGEHLTLQAVLVDSHGSPISKATIYFTTQTAFLTGKGDMVLAQAVTNKDGQAVAQFVDDTSGTITLRAEFRGDAQYAPSNATAQVNAAGAGQIYDEHVGVDIPGFNVPPVLSSKASAASSQAQVQGLPASYKSLWPTITAWPIAAALIIVWTMFFRAVTFLFRIAKPGREVGESSPAFDQKR